jgi:hypothetical protein
MDRVESKVGPRATIDPVRIEEVRPHETIGKVDPVKRFRLHALGQRPGRSLPILPITGNTCKRVQNKIKNNVSRSHHKHHHQYLGILPSFNFRLIGKTVNRGPLDDYSNPTFLLQTMNVHL